MRPKEVADNDLVLRIARDQAVRWKRTLELLAEAEAEEIERAQEEL